MRNQFTLHHEFRIDTGKTKFGQNTNDILSVCGSYEQRTQRSLWHWPGNTTFCMVQAEKVEETSKHGVLVRHKTCSTERIKVLSNKIDPRSPPKISFGDNWMKELGSEVAGNSEDSNQIQPKFKNPIVRTGETRQEWATILFDYSGNRQRCLVWPWKPQCKNGETL